MKTSRILATFLALAMVFTLGGVSFAENTAEEAPSTLVYATSTFGQKFSPLISKAVAVKMGWQAGCHLTQVGVVLVKEDQTAGAGCQPAVQGSLGLLYSLERAEAKQMGTSHIGN